MKWLDAIQKVLSDEQTAMHYTDITDKIIEKKYRTKSEIGATPQNSVRSRLAVNPELFERVAPGMYRLASDALLEETLAGYPDEESIVEMEIERENDSKIIKTYGMYWARDVINWNSRPKLLGVQNYGAETVNFSEIRGIYLLYDNREVIYIGQAVEQGILKRLVVHTKDRLAGRWNRFSWFGFDGVKADGSLSMSPITVKLDLNDLANTLEGVLIEGLEPRQNRKAGNMFGDEYLQVVDKKLELAKAQALIAAELSKK